MATEAPARANVLWSGDALRVCERLEGELFDLVYLDPPFNVGGGFSARTREGEARGRTSARSGPKAYDDAWGGRSAFLEMLGPRIRAIRERMTARASLWLHLDHRTVHYAKVMCDEIFGATAFRAEIIWVPGNGSRGRRGPSVTHQTILLFTKDASPAAPFVWNADDPILREPFARSSLATHFRSRDEQGRVYRERTIAGKTYRYYADEGRRLGSVWTDISAMTANTPLCKEGTGYPTQKPEKLLERIIRAASSPGDVVADLMCGSGTTLRVAARLGRSFVGGDESPVALAIAHTRLTEAGIAFHVRTANDANEA